jgi:hypothetical protein
MYLNHIRTKHGALLDTIRNEEQLTPKTNADIAAILEEFIPLSGLTLKA